MKRGLVVLPFVAALALAGCAAPPMDAGMSAGLDNKPPQVQRVRVSLATDFAPGRTALTPIQASRLETFIDQAGLQPDDRAYVAVPSGDPLATKRVAQLGDLLARRGIGLERVAAPPSGVAPNHVLLMVDHYIVTPPSCPDWSASPATPHDNLPSSNFGCASENNLALMVANPRDLMMGRTMGPADAEHAALSIERYRADKVKPFLGGGLSGQQGAQGTSASSGGSTPPGQ